MKTDKLELQLNADEILESLQKQTEKIEFLSEKSKKAKEEIQKNGNPWERLPQA